MKTEIVYKVVRNRAETRRYFGLAGEKPGTYGSATLPRRQGVVYRRGVWAYPVKNANPFLMVFTTLRQAMHFRSKELFLGPQTRLIFKAEAQGVERPPVVLNYSLPLGTRLAKKVRLLELALPILLLTCVANAEPPPPDCCPADPLCNTNVPFTSYYPPTPDGGIIKTALRFEHIFEPGHTYELQYCHALGGQWFAYSRVSPEMGGITRTTILITDHPVYDEPTRFFRVMRN